jgi:hypothetical protein
VNDSRELIERSARVRLLTNTFSKTTAESGSSRTSAFPQDITAAATPAIKINLFIQYYAKIKYTTIRSSHGIVEITKDLPTSLGNTGSLPRYVEVKLEKRYKKNYAHTLCILHDKP